MGSGVRLDLKTISDKVARERLERDCHSLGDAVRRRCLFTIRFVYDGSRRSGGTGELTLIDARNGEGQIITAKGRR